jgi:hypothetical protein
MRKGLTLISNLRHVAWPAVGTLNLRSQEHLSGRADIAHEPDGDFPGFGFVMGSHEPG